MNERRESSWILGKDDKCQRAKKGAMDSVLNKAIPNRGRRKTQREMKHE